MKENYTMIDASAPKKGLQISYLASYNGDTKSYKYTKLNIYCPTVYSTDNKCKMTNTSSNSII